MRTNLIFFLLLCSLSAFAQPSIVDTTRFSVRNGNAYFVATALALKNYIGGGGDVTNGGNSFGTAMTIGTNDNYALNLETNGTTRATFSNAGAITFNSLGGGTTISTDAGEINLYRKRYATSSTADFLFSSESDGTPAAGFGTSLLMRGQSSTTLNRDIGRISAIWTTSTDASRTSNMVFSTVNSATTNEALRLYGNQRAMIGGGSNEASAALQVNSTTAGFLLPKMTNTQMLAITSPAEGLEVYNTTIGGKCIFNGTDWDRLSCSKTPSVTVGAAAGTGATASVVGNDMAGIITVTTGTSLAVGNIVTLDFHTDYDVAPKAVMISPANEAARSPIYLQPLNRGWHALHSDITVVDFEIDSGSGLNGGAESTEYKIYYHVIQ